ncbi:MAG TPA: LLM class flavin-dependent oxidoreductase [Burkholderiales bacterium]|nr:LLM class flavin-dependent oxidoreductase [Burkholderiales bacterium]
MRAGLALMSRPPADQQPGSGLQWVTQFGTKAEKLGFAAIWVGDSMGRGRHTLDPTVTLSALHAGTSRIELGIGVLQVPLRRPGELAHRIQSLNVLLAGRLRLGVGAGSTRADFELAGADYDKRFKTFNEGLEVMRALWRGERVNGASLLAWPGTEGGPPLFLGAWRSAKAIERAAREFDGWVASGLHSTWEDLETGMKTYRAHGGKRAILTNIHTDIHTEPRDGSPLHAGTISLQCTPAEARERLQRIEAIGFDDVMLICHDRSERHLVAVRALVP